MIATTAMVLPRSKDVLAQVRDYVIFTVVRGTDYRSAILLVNIAEILLYLTPPFDNQSSQEDFQMIPRWEFNIKSDGVLSQSEALHSSDKFEHLHDVRVFHAKLFQLCARTFVQKL